MNKHARLGSIMTYIPYPLRWAAVLFALFAVLIGAVPIIGDRVRASACDCIRIEDDYTNTSYYDVATGRIFAPTSNRMSSYIVSASPDAHYLAYALQADNNPTFSLFLETVGTSNRRTRLLQSDILGIDPSDIRWSPDGRLIAYSWLSDGSMYIALSDTDGHQIAHRVLENALEATQKVSLHGWSADGKYLAVSIEDVLTNTTTIHILSALDLQTIKTPPLTTNITPRTSDGGDGGLDVYDMVQWGASGDWLDYLTRKPDGHNTLVLYSPGTGQMLTADTSGTTYIDGAQVLWSPDGKHIAVLYTLKDSEFGAWSLDVFGIDGSAFYKVTDDAANTLVLAGGAGNSPQFTWSTDSRSLFYPQNLTPYSADHGDLMAFNLDRKQIVLLRANIYLNPNMTDDNRYILAKWDDGAVEKIDIIDTTTLQPVATLDALYSDVLRQVYGRYSAESGWLIVNEDTIDTWAINVRTGVRRPVPVALTANYNGFTSFTADYRFAGGFEIYSKLGPNSDYRVLSLDDGVFHNFHLPPSITNPTLIDYSTDGEVTLSSVDVAKGNTLISVLRSDSSIRRQFTMKGNYSSIRRVTCSPVM